MNRTEITQKIAPYRDILQFVVVMMVANGIWKICVHGDEDTHITDAIVTCFGQDVSSLFNCMAQTVARQVYVWVHLILQDCLFIGNNIIQYPTGYKVAVVWACAGLKQMFIFSCILLCSRGKQIHKLWFIPLGLLLVHLINVLRIGTIGLICMNHPDWFDLMHGVIFKYLFYGLIFLYWVLWNERFNTGNKKG